ncbi:MAG: hypothetical protein A2681_01790 [Candidatus Liptonbacteria bacterium RIFCSPHIGHO2_01_FULL_56_18b]|nr:MAG: hypothetical protein A2681_01790 [Candidatus Liptonbacteria bacterium RIFCSPHIGHO2_01_FULL_56_18b]
MPMRTQGMHKLFVVLLLAVLALGAEGLRTRAQTVNGGTQRTREELESLIRARAQELEKVNRELETAEGNLKTTKDQKVGLQRELNTLQASINQLQLNMRADEIASQKLNLEIDSLGYDIGDIEASMDDKRSAIAHILRELQTNDQDNLLVVFLKNKSLADAVLATQSLSNIKSQLSVDIAGLNNLHQELNDKLDSVGDKKAEVELHRQNLAARKSIVEDQKGSRQVVLDQTKNKESVYEQQLSDLKKQQDAIADEIGKIEDELRASFNVSILPTKRLGVFAWPVQMVAQGGRGIITQHFGEVSYLYRGKPHNGLDIGVPLGTPVFAVDDGVVIAVDNNDKSRWNKYQYGKYILIRHKNDIATLYAHLSQQVVVKGAEVKRGSLIGYSGATGYATGPHLHLGAYWAPSILMQSFPPAAGLVPVGVLVNPEDYL